LVPPSTVWNSSNGSYPHQQFDQVLQQITALNTSNQEIINELKQDLKNHREQNEKIVKELHTTISALFGERTKLWDEIIKLQQQVKDLLAPQPQHTEKCSSTPDPIPKPSKPPTPSTKRKHTRSTLIINKELTDVDDEASASTKTKKARMKHATTPTPDPEHPHNTDDDEL
jgi:glutamate racemase